MAVCRRCGNQMADTAAACPACGELRYQPPQAAAPAQQYAAAPQPAQYPQYAQPQQQAYAAPQPAPAYAMPVSADEARSFIGALFDLSFTSFITTKLVKIWYILILIVASGYGLVLLVGGLLSLSNSQTFMYGLMGIVGAPLVFLIFAISGRIFMEVLIVIFRGAEHLAEIAKQTRR